MAAAFKPFYSTSYGEGFGYNEREGGNTATFRNRYLDDGYRGSSQLGPSRFQSTRAQASQDLASTDAALAQTAALPANTLRPATASPLSRSTGLLETTQRDIQAQPYRVYTGYSRPKTAGGSPQQQQRFASSTGSFAGKTASPSATYLPPLQHQQWEGAYANLSPISQAQVQGQGQAQAQTTASEQGAAAYGDVSKSPYYIAPYAVPPSEQFAPPAVALGNRTYEFATDSPNYRYRDAFSSRPGTRVSNKPLQDPGQSIPFGRLQAEDAKAVRHKMSMDSWDTFNVADRSGKVNFDLSCLGRSHSHRSRELDPENYCKTSISRRLPQGAQLRYHLPGYSGHVASEALRHGATYGKTTRMAIAESPNGL